MSQNSTSLIKTLANIITVNLIALSQKTGKPVSQLISKENLIALATFFQEEKISNQGLLKTLEILLEEPNSSTEEVITTHGLLQISDDTALRAFVDVVLQNNPNAVDQYKSGKTQIIGFLVGQCMKESKGQGNPQKFTEMLKDKLG